MEMLTNIWNFLTTENVGFVNVMVSLFGFIESYLSLMLFVNLLNIKCSGKQKLLYVILSGVICTILIQKLVPSPFNVVFNYLTVFAIIYFIFKQGFLKTLLALFVPVLIFGLASVLILNIYIKILNITYEQCSFIPLFRFFYFIILYIIVSLIAFILKLVCLKINAIRLTII